MPMPRRALLLLSVASAIATAQAPPPPAVPANPPTAADSAIRIVLLTMGQGDQVYEMFGHNALWIRDRVTGIDSVYNWGVFDFRTEGFLVRFLQGDMRYTMDAQDIQMTMAYYQYLNRRIWAQELDLTASQKRALVDFIVWNSRPENRQYRYDYYLDNCSTRVRDAIDRVLGGRLREYLKGIPTDQTYRSHSLRMMQGAPVLLTGIEMGLGRRADTRLSADEAAFLPVQLMNYIAEFQVDGRPLVSRSMLLSEASRPAEPTNIPALWKALLPIGLAVAGLIAWLALGLHARVASATAIAIVAGFLGIIGTIILLLVTVTDHVAAHANENMWLLNPVWLVVAVSVPRALLGRRWSPVARWSAMAGAALGLCAVLMHVLTLSRQPNWDVIGFLLPAEIAIAIVAVKSIRRQVPLDSVAR